MGTDMGTAKGWSEDTDAHGTGLGAMGMGMAIRTSKGPGIKGGMQ